MADKTPRVEKKILPNGLTIYHEYDNSVEGVFIGAVIHAGSKHEQKPGVAHFLEHVVMTQKIPGFDTGLHGIEKRFGYKNMWFDDAYTDRLGTVYSFCASPSFSEFPVFLETFRDVLFHMSIDGDIEAERQTVCSEINLTDYDFVNKSEKMMYRELFPGTWIEKNPFNLGRVGDVAEITVDDLNAFKNTHYTPQNTSIFIFGNLQTEDVESVFSRVQMEKPSCLVTSIEPLMYTPYVREEIFYYDEETQQASDDQGLVDIAWAVPDLGEKHNLTYGFMGELLSRTALHHPLRDDRRLYGTSVGFRWLGEVGLFTLRVQDNIPFGEEDIVRLIHLLSSRKVLDEYLEPVERLFSPTYMQLRFSPKERMNVRVRQLVDTGTCYSIEEYCERLQSVSKDEVYEIIAKYITPSSCTIFMC